MEKFEKLGISKQLLKAIEDAKFTEPSEIQEKVIPLALAGKDVIGGSATGSGKTLAFGAAIIDKIKPGIGIQAMILVPTRELAEQVANSLWNFSSYKELEVAAVYGGVGMGPQVEALRYADIVVGTPGRLLDHINQRTIDLKKVKFLVLDEADRMLDMGFVRDVTMIISYLPNERQTFLFSATISQDIMYLARKYMKDPVSVEVESYVDASKLQQFYYDVPSNARFSLLVHLLKNEKPGLVMVFCNTRRNTDFVAKNLERYGIDSTAIHGGLAQNKRTSIIEKFHSSKVFVLVCTDVAARGLDIKGVSHVYNYDIPKTSKEYIHRIGRTARAGEEGKAISIVSQRDYENFAEVIRDPEISIEKLETPKVENVHIDFREHESSGGRDGGRFGGRGGFRSRSGGFGGRGGSRGGGRGFGGRSGGRFSSGRSSNDRRNNRRDSRGPSRGRGSDRFGGRR
jgi:ATP-dependent RNA helicase DeaD